MSRRDLMKHLRGEGCVVAGEGGRHTHVLNPANGRKSSVPRHTEIRREIARKICDDLAVVRPASLS